MGDLHHVSVYRIAGTGCEVNDPLSDLYVEALKIEDNCAVCEKSIGNFSRIVNGCRFDDAYFHACLRILFLDLSGY